MAYSVHTGAYWTRPPLDRLWTATGPLLDRYWTGPPLDRPSPDHNRTTTEPVWTGLVHIHSLHGMSSVHSAHTALDRYWTTTGPPLGQWTAHHQTTTGPQRNRSGPVQCPYTPFTAGPAFTAPILHWTATGPPLDRHWATGPPLTRPPQGHNKTGLDRSSAHTQLTQQVQRS